ncbi:MAG TPA: hypothetical protein VGI19_18600 [Candidatus Cybelea sp.]|jgi:hypothetical protein
MMPEATNEDLLYVSNYDVVLVFSYPQGKLVGTLKGFYSAVGECVDKQGDVFVVNFKPLAVYEYSHGGTKRIATYLDKKAGSNGCAINPLNGDLAVSGVSSYVDVFKSPNQRPTSYKDKNMFYGAFITYDDKGNLFFQGLMNPSGATRLSELASGSSTFVGISLDAPTYSEGGLLWNDGYLTAGSNDHKTVSIYQFQVTGTVAHKVSATPLGKAAHIVLQYFIDGQTLIVPNLYGSGSNVLLYDYPAGGTPTSIITKRITAARGLVVSRAASH